MISKKTSYGLLFLTLTLPLCAMKKTTHDPILVSLRSLAHKMHTIVQSKDTSTTPIQKKLDEQLELCYQTLLNHKHHVNPKDHSEAFFIACSYGDRKILKLFMPTFNIESKNEGGQTPLMVAAYHGNCETLDLLLQHNADLKKTDKEGLSVKHYVSFAPTLSSQDPSLALTALIARTRFNNSDPFEQCRSLLLKKEEELSHPKNP